MADSNSHQPRCPCGFWGTPENQGLCSKCFKERTQQKNNEADNASGSTTESPMVTESTLKPTDLSKAFERVSAPSPPSSSQSSGTDLPAASSPSPCLEACDDQQETEEATDDLEESAAGSNKRDISEVHQDPDRPVQKNKKRCFKCNCKLELAIREIGRCKCDYVFCQLHRLPEQHDCTFDHKESGRQQAREKMVSPKKNAGTSIRRMDSSS